MSGRTPASDPTSDRGRSRARWLLAFGMLAFGGMLTAAAEAAAPPAFAARASITPRLYYIGDAAGSVYTFTVKNTGSTNSIGAVEINRPANGWAVTSCPTAPAGWTKTASSTKCRYKSAPTYADDIKPGNAKTFGVKATTAPGDANRTGTWSVVVSRSYHFDNTSLLKAASPYGAGLATRLHTFELTTAVVSDAVRPHGSACPPANKEAVLGSVKTIVVCGKNRANTRLTPTSAYSTLAGTFVKTKGTFLSGSVSRNSGNVVLAQWTATTVTDIFGEGKKVVAGIGASANRTSPLRTFTGYSATSQPPVAVADVYSVNEDTQLVKDDTNGVLSNDSDPETDPLSVTNLTQPSHGTLVLDTTDGSFTYDPDADFHGVDSFTYTANDTHSDSSAVTVTITVNPVNDAPVGADDAKTTDEDTSAAIDVLDNDGDVDGNALAVSAVDTTGTAGDVTNNGTDVTYDPDGAFEGLGNGQTATDTFTYTVSDGNGGTDTQTVTVTITGVNDAPVAVADAASTDEETAIPITVVTNDSDDETSFTVTSVDVTGTSGTVVNNNDGTVTYDPADGWEELADGEDENDTFTYTITDGQGATATATVTVDVNGINDAPGAVADAQTVGEDSAGATVDVLGNDTDAESQTLTVTGINVTGTVGTVTNNGTDVTYDPDGQFENLTTNTATDTFTYTVTDSQGLTDTETVTITVQGSNDLPVAADDAASTDEATSVPITVAGNDSDTEGAFTVTSVDTTGTAGTVTNNNDGTVTYNPNGAFEDLANGEDRDDTFAYTITDGTGATDTATVTVDVNGINDAPVAAADGPSIGEDSTGSTVNVLGNDTDAESQTLTVTAIDTTGTTGTVTNNGTDVTYDPNGQYESLGTGQTASDSFTYTVTDSQGATDTETVTVTVTGVNDLPAAVDDIASTDEATQIGPIAILANDSDDEGALTLTSVGTTGTDGQVTNNNDGTVTYNPNGAFEDLANGESETDTFTYTVTDTNGATDTATVTITVNGINDAPVAAADARSVGENASGAAVDVLANDTDAEGQTLTVTGIDITGTSGMVTNNGTDVTYDPNGVFEYLDDTETAQDTFTYTVTDSQGATDTETVTITVNGANDAPVAANDGPFQAIQSQNLTLTVPGVLANDTDADGETITAGNASDPAHGTVTLDSDGSFSYDPDTGYLGADSFTYDVSDGTSTDTATVSIVVVPPNDTPTADNTSASGDEDGGAITVTLTGHDADGDGLTFSPGTATNGLVTIPTGVSCDANVPSVCTATVTYTPGPDFFGSDSFTYTVNDGTIDSTPATASITVDAVNDEPSFTKGANQTVNEDAGAQTVTGWATAISAGPANEAAQLVTFTVTGTTDDALFSVLPAVSPAGDLTYTPALNANGVATVSVRISDDGGTANGGDDTSPVQTFTITVGAVNDAPSFTKGADQTLNEDAGAQSVSNWATAISKGPADESAQTVSFTTSNDNNALFSVQPGVSPTGTLTYTPAPDAVGTATVTIYLADTGGTANGGDDTSDSQTFTVTVNPINDQPSFTDDGDQTVLEDAGAQTVNGFVNSTSAGPADEAAQTVTVTVTGTSNDALFSVVPTIDSAGTLTYTPALDANGSATVTAVATDDGGTANGGDATGANETFVITVTAVNDVPSFTKGADQTLNEDAGAQSVSNWATAISEGPANEVAQTVSFTVTNNNNALFSSQPAVSPTGTLTYTPAANQYGTATVSVSISDNGGTANGGDDTSDVQTFVVTVDPVNDAPVAAAKAFTVQANMKISLGGLLTGATDPNDVAGDATWTPSFTLGSITAGAGCVGCTISNVDNAAGTFDFDPPAGGTGDYTVTYTVVDNGHPAPGATSAAQTITFTVGGPVIWFVDADGGAGGTGRLSAPFNTLAAATTAMGTDTNERIFVEDGNVTGNVTLQTDGWLLSDAVTGTSFDSVMAITPPAGTIARPTINASQRTLTGTVTLGTNSVVRGFNLTPTTGNQGLVAASRTGLVVNQMSISTTNARAVNLSGSSGVLSLTRVDASGADRGISLVNTNVSAGSFTITGTGTAGSGGTITGSTGTAVGEAGIHLNNTKNVTLDRMVVTAGSGNGIYGSAVETLSLSNTTVSNNGTNEVNDHSGLNFANLTGTSTITGITVFGSREDNAKIMNTSGSATITVSNSTFRDNNASVGANGLYMDASNSALMTVTSTNNTFQRNHTSGLAIFGQSTQKMTATVTGGTYVTDNGVGLDIETNGPGGMSFNVNGGTVTGCAACAAPVVVYKGTGATGTGANATAGTISGMTVSNGNSLNAPGIWVHGEGPGASRIAITNNNVSQVAHYGIHVSFGNTTSAQQTDVSVTGNTLNQGTTNGTLEGIFVDSGLLAADVSSMCAHVSGNSVTNALDDDIRVRNRQAGTSLRLPGYGGAATDHTAVANFLKGQNTILDAFSSANASSTGIAGGAACSAP